MEILTNRQLNSAHSLLMISMILDMNLYFFFYIQLQFLLLLICFICVFWVVGKAKDEEKQMYKHMMQFQTTLQFLQLKQWYFKISTNLISGICPFPIKELQLTDIYSFIWSFLEVFPQEVCACIAAALSNTPLVVGNIENISSQVFEILSTTTDINMRDALTGLTLVRPMALIDDKYVLMNVITNEHENDFIQLMIRFLVEDPSEEVVEFQSYLGKCRSAISNMITSVHDSMDQYLTYSFEHIESPVIGERDVSTVLFSQCLACVKTCDQCIENASDFVLIPLQDPTPRVLILGLYLLQTLTYRTSFVLNETHIELVVNAVCSDDSSVSLDASQCLFSLLAKVSEDVRAECASQIFGRIQNVEEENTRAELLRCLTSMCKDLTPEIACSLIEPTVDLTQQIIDSSDESAPLVSLSPCIGFLGALFSRGGEQAADFNDVILDLAQMLLTHSFISDGVTLLNPLVKTFGDKNTGLVSMAIDVVVKFLPLAKSEEDLLPLMRLTHRLVRRIENYETCEFVFNTCVNIGLAVDASDELKSEIVPVIADLFDMHQEIVQSRLVDAFTVIFTAPFSVNRPDLLHLVTQCGQMFVAGNPIFEKALSSVVAEVALKAKNSKISTEDFLTLVQLVSSFIPDSEYILKNLGWTYRNFIQSYTEPEINDQILEIIPQEEVQTPKVNYFL